MVVARLDGETGTLDVCNLGDAGLRVLREGRVVATTQDQQVRVVVACWNAQAWVCVCKRRLRENYHRVDMAPSAFPCWKGGWLDKRARSDFPQYQRMDVAVTSH
jgi:hypothetical protein